ncbi:DUF2164 domain-containing protein [Paenalcaligenes suwonensis]|uniref:DUF2164 domain-containing protein n=1 Tax=Paenalcaligenes suwonensis TaxID=1202713 RepID=UPI00140D1CC8|nr:DUF2164 domain-containing protein [Paenalcaligenes suwonensis]NHC62982.1 DUF2164 domain-containing protein [Paenalcaligenes suwonensis]
MTIELDRDTKTRAIQSLQRYFDENMEEPIGNITANALLNFFLQDIAPSVYNQAVRDVQANMQQKTEDLDIEVHADEFQYWPKQKR